MNARAARVPAHEITVDAEVLARELVELGCSGSPGNDPPCMVALALARCRARIDRGGWAHQRHDARPSGWRPPPRMRLATVSGKDRAAGDFE